MPYSYTLEITLTTTRYSVDGKRISHHDALWRKIKQQPLEIAEEVLISALISGKNKVQAQEKAGEYTSSAYFQAKLLQAEREQPSCLVYIDCKKYDKKSNKEQRA